MKVLYAWTRWGSSMLCLLMTSVGVIAQCSLQVTLGEDQQVCSNRRAIEIQSSIDGIVLNHSWDPIEKIDNPFSLSPKALAGKAEEVTYTLTVLGYHPNDNLIVNGDFELGDTLFDSRYESASNSPGGYLIDSIGTALFDDAKPCRDHTSGFGHMLLAKVSDAADVPIWCQEVAIEPNRNYHFEGVATGLRTNLPPVLVLKVNDEIISSGTLGSFACSWQGIQGDWFSGNAQTAKICIHVSTEDIGKNTDFAIDDLGMYEVCEVSDQLQYKSHPFEIVGPKEVELPCGQELLLNTSMIGPSTDVLFRWRTRGGNFQSDVHSPDVTIDMGGMYELGAGWTNNIVTCWDTLQVTVNAVLKEDLELLQNSIGTCEDPLVEVQLNRMLTLPNLKYEWSSGDTLIESTAGTEIAVTSPGIYALHISDTLRRCDWNQSISVFIDALSEPTFSIGDFDCTTQGRDLSIESPVGAFTYSINGVDFQRDPTFRNLMGGSYEIRVQNEDGCMGRDTFFLPAEESVQLLLPDRLFLERGEGVIPLELNVMPSDITEVMWNPSTFLSCIDCLSPSVQVDEATDFRIMVVDHNECRDTATVRVVPVSDQPLFLPSAFTPNGDGINDLLRPAFGTRIDAILMLRVFDRWGNMVFEAEGEEANRGWSGNINSKQAPEGPYLYSVQYRGVDQSEQIASQSVILIR